VSNCSFGLDCPLTTGCRSVLSTELEAFYAIKEQSKARQFLVQDDDKQNIVNIFESVNEARQNMIVRVLAMLWQAKANRARFS
jgi:hypothetical protein